MRKTTYKGIDIVNPAKVAHHVYVNGVQVMSGTLYECKEFIDNNIKILEMNCE